MPIFLYEDRPQQIPGVKLLILSIVGHCPNWEIFLNFPHAGSRFRAWLQHFPQVRLEQVKLGVERSFNVKPDVLLSALRRGFSECIWIDTDIILHRDPRELFQVPEDTIIITQDPWEYKDGSTHRAKRWNLSEARSLPGPFNSSVIRVTQQHTRLLETWQSMLRLNWYIDMQSLPANARDRLALGDQDAISALLASKDFSSIPIKCLRHPTEILQHHGAGAYSLRERWQTLRSRLPPLIHAMGSVKPWQMAARPSLFREPRAYYERYYLELSPYLHTARQYRTQLEEPADWMDIWTRPAQASHLASFRSPILQGILQATLHRESMQMRQSHNKIR